MGSDRATGRPNHQQAEVAEVASRLFGRTVQPGAVIGETLRRATDALEVEDPVALDALRQRVASGSPPLDLEAFLGAPLGENPEQLPETVRDLVDLVYLRLGRQQHVA